MVIRGQRQCLRRIASKYPPAKPVALRLLAPQRGLTAIGESQKPTPQHGVKHTPGNVKLRESPRHSRGFTIINHPADRGETQGAPPRPDSAIHRASAAERRRYGSGEDAPLLADHGGPCALCETQMHGGTGVWHHQGNTGIPAILSAGSKYPPAKPGALVCEPLKAA